MRLDKGPGRLLKLLSAALLAQRISAGLSPVARFPLVFLAVLLADNLRFRPSGESPVYLEDIVVGVILYGGLGLLCYALDFGLSLRTGRHAGPVFPALVLALIDRTWPGSRFSPKRR